MLEDCTLSEYANLETQICMKIQSGSYVGLVLVLLHFIPVNHSDAFI